MEGPIFKQLFYTPNNMWKDYYDAYSIGGKLNDNALKIRSVLDSTYTPSEGISNYRVHFASIQYVETPNFYPRLVIHPFKPCYKYYRLKENNFSIVKKWLPIQRKGTKVYLLDGPYMDKMKTLLLEYGYEPENKNFDLWRRETDYRSSPFYL